MGYNIKSREALAIRLPPRNTIKGGWHGMAWAYCLPWIPEEESGKGLPAMPVNAVGRHR